MLLVEEDSTGTIFLLKLLIVHLYKIPGRSINSTLDRNYCTVYGNTSLKNNTKLQRHPHVSVQISLYRQKRFRAVTLLDKLFK